MQLRSHQFWQKLSISQKAVDRRIRQGISVSETDLPVNENYVQGVKSVGANTFFKTKWMNGVLVQCDASLVPSIESLGFVERVEFVAPNQRLNGGRKRMENRRPSLRILRIS